MTQVTITTTRVWGITGRSVRGAQHTRANVENQDSIEWYPKIGAVDTMPLVMAVSDGHGNSRYIRSRAGSRLAVACAIKVLRVFYKDNGMIRDPALLQVLAEPLPERIMESWREHVQEDLDYNPFTTEEQIKIKSLDEQSQITLARDPRNAYGCTLLATMITPWCILYLKIGDGDILCMGSDMKVYTPISNDSGLDSSTTYSMVDKDATKKIKVVVEDADKPVIITMTTDGYTNSYPTSEEDFRKIVPDYYAKVQGMGEMWQNKLYNELGPILEATTQKGSGDDISIIVACQSRSGQVK